MDYITYRDIVTKACDNMVKNNNNLYILDVQKDLLWMAYMESFPEGPIRQEYNCINCRRFITRFGKVVSIDSNYQIHSFWEDVQVDDPLFKNIAANMLQVIKGSKICSVFYSTEEFIGQASNVQLLPDKSTTTWNHFYVQLPGTYLRTSDTFATLRAQKNSDYQVWKNALTHINIDAVSSVLDLIEDNNLYRGDQYKNMLTQLYNYLNQVPSNNIEIFAWKTVMNIPESVSHILNTAIGTLLEDISDGVNIEEAVKSYEVKVAPYNYHRPKGIITKTQVERAYKTVQELGYEDSLERCHAKVEDISVEDVIFVNRETRKHIAGGFDTLLKETTSSQKINSDKCVPISIETFIKNVVPGITKLEMFVDNSLLSNLVTLTAPANKKAPSIFKWDNGFAWVYNGNISDAIRKRVKEVGGKVDGYMRISLHWFNYDDLDLHMRTPYREVYYGNKGGLLDVDMNPGGATEYQARQSPNKFSRDSVENIIFSTVPDEGTYKIWVNQFAKVESVDYGFEVEVELNGEIHTYTYNDIMPNNSNVNVIEFTSDGKSVTITEEYLSSNKKPKEVWNIKSNSWVEVSAMCLSPNYWGENKIGAKHYFFLLKDCKNPDAVRGYFNEYLKDELTQHHKRVFEVLASKSLVPYSDSQMSGLGFISSSNNEFLVKIDSSKIYKVII